MNNQWIINLETRKINRKNVYRNKQSCPRVGIFDSDSSNWGHITKFVLNLISFTVSSEKFNYQVAGAEISAPEQLWE